LILRNKYTELHGQQNIKIHYLCILTLLVFGSFHCIEKPPIRFILGYLY